MREHEVPTHVQAEDRVLLGFTFPQIVAVTAVCAIAYGAYRYAPIGPSEVRMALAVVLGLVGIAMIVGKIGGRRLPLVAADLLKYRLGARVHAGPVSQLVRSEPPAPPRPARSVPGPLRLMAKRTKRALRRLRKKRNRDKDRRNGRMPFRPHGWFGKRRKNRGHQQGPGHSAETPESTRRKPTRGLMAVVAAVLVAATATVPQAAQADGHDRWQDEIDFEVTDPVEGRRVFVERLTVSGERAAVTLRAATGLDIRVRAFGGPGGNVAALLGARPPARPGGALPLQVPPARTEALLHRLVGGHAGAGGCAHRRARHDPASAPRGRGRALQPSGIDVPWMDAAGRQRSDRVGVRDERRAPGRSPDGGGARGASPRRRSWRPRSRRSPGRSPHPPARSTASSPLRPR